MALAARERAEKKQQEYEDRLRSMQEEMERSQVSKKCEKKIAEIW
jgi:hypothetical protein